MRLIYLPYIFPISPSPLSATITYGESCPEFKVAYDGFVNGEGEEVLASLPVVACEGYPMLGHILSPSREVQP